MTMIRSGYPQLFGADLEQVVTREAKGAPGSAPVPIVLRRCVEEVERRGLDIIGLYRLCGSASKKRLLRFVRQFYQKKMFNNVYFIFKKKITEKHLNVIVVL